MHTQTLDGAWQFRQIDGAHRHRWLPAQVPGGVHTDLLALGRIPDPFVADHEKDVRWVAESDWAYRRTFKLDPALMDEPCVFLVCDGLDTLAQVTLNGQPLGSTGNAFRRYRWPIKSLLQEGENELLIHFTSPVRYAAARQTERPMQGVNQAIAGAPHVRKAPCQFGWDWGPMLPPIGIWKPIRLEGYATARLDELHLRQHHAAARVALEVGATIERWQEGPLALRIQVTGPAGSVTARQRTLTEDAIFVELPIDDPQLWWPNGYGEQPLYGVELLLLAGEQLLDRRAYQVGLRTIELRQEDDAWGESFTFVVNGVEIFAKGANWIPADSFPTRISDGAMEHLIRSAAATHQNMLRVWGGGFYEEERFYDLCDRYGLLVWQDCVFSCSVYPLDQADFLQNVEREVRQNLRRIRHRASLALWCGNNEMEWGWEAWGWAEFPFREELEALAERAPVLEQLLEGYRRYRPIPEWRVLRQAYDRSFHTLLPGWVAEEDPDTPYWPSSPSSGTPFRNANGQARGDAHYWGVWHRRRPFTAYRDQFPRFMSEFGFQSLPPLETIAAYADEADWNLTSYVMEHHQRGNHGNGLILAQMTETFRMPKDFPSLVYLSLILQAEGIRYGVEHWRRHRDRVSGTLYWQLNDCWPVASWSSLDYFGRWKALHYAARRFYAPVLLSVEDEPPRMSVHVTSDLTRPWRGTLHWSLETLRGGVVETGQTAVSVEPLTSTEVAPLDFGDRVSAANERDVILVCELWQGDELVSRVVTPFVPSKYLSLADPGLEVELASAGPDRLAVQVAAESLARFVELALDGADVVFSDSYFDLPAGRATTVTFPLPGGWGLPQACQALRVRSLYDSFT